MKKTYMSPEIELLTFAALEKLALLDNHAEDDEDNKTLGESQKEEEYNPNLPWG